MSKVITFSRTYPSYHPRAGEETQFVEKILVSIGSDKLVYGCGLNIPVDPSISGLSPKHHTIRSGHRWKAGDWFSPRVWSGKPYRSKQIQFAPDIQIKKVWDFEIHPEFTTGYCIGPKIVTLQMLAEIAKNDGLECDDLETWFNQKYFKGQIICWNENINY